METKEILQLKEQAHEAICKACNLLSRAKFGFNDELKDEQTGKSIEQLYNMIYNALSDAENAELELREIPYDIWCTTDCAAYRSGTCPYPRKQKGSCPRVKERLENALKLE